MNQQILSIQRISKSFGGKLVLSNVSFSLRRGEILGVLGKNGAGKTVLVNTLLGLIKPDFGEIKIFEKHLDRNLTEIRQRINFASSYSHLQLQMSIFDNLHTFAGLYQIQNKERKIAILLRAFDIWELAQQNKKLSILSSGEQTRVMLCKALLNDPELLLLDEPLSSLDPIGKKRIQSILLSLCKKNQAAIVYTSHNLSEIAELCKKILVLQSGKISYFGPVLPIRTMLKKF